jgi:hypothetical protein
LPVIGEFPYYQIWAGIFKSILPGRLMGWLLNNKIPPTQNLYTGIVKNKGLLITFL